MLGQLASTCSLCDEVEVLNKDANRCILKNNEVWVGVLRTCEQKMHISFSVTKTECHDRSHHMAGRVYF